MTRRSLTLAALLTLTSLAHAQQTPPRLTFDVASIRASKPGHTSGGIKPIPGGNGYTAQNISIKLIISLMYKVPMRQITNAPSWLDDERYDIEARTDRPYSKDDLQLMFRNLLADRFNLKLHTLIKEGPVYALTIDPAGLKMRPNDNPEDYAIPLNRSGENAFTGKRVPMRYLCWWLGQQLQNDERPVLDNTGLTGNYDFTLSFKPVLPPGAPQEDQTPDLPSLFDAMKQQLGLKLQAQKGPVTYYVIDHIENPSDN